MELRRSLRRRLAPRPRGSSTHRPGWGSPVAKARSMSETASRGMKLVSSIPYVFFQFMGQSQGLRLHPPCLGWQRSGGSSKTDSSSSWNSFGQREGTFISPPLPEAPGGAYTAQPPSPAPGRNGVCHERRSISAPTSALIAAAGLIGWRRGGVIPPMRGRLWVPNHVGEI